MTDSSSASDTQSRDAATKAAPVHLWLVHLDTTSGADASCWSVLSPEERTRADSFVFDRDRNRFVVGRASLRRILAEILDAPAEALQICTAERGKPFLQHYSSKSVIEFNMSRSESLAAIAVSRIAPIGIDIEKTVYVETTRSLISTALSDREKAEIENIHGSERINMFYKFWTQKEAIAKLSGVGFSVDPYEICSIQKEEIDNMRNLHVKTLSLEESALCSLAAAREFYVVYHGRW